MLTVVIQNEFINKTLRLVNEKKILDLVLENFIAYETLKMCWVNFVKPRTWLSDIIFNWVRISCSLLKEFKRVIQ